MGSLICSQEQGSTLQVNTELFLDSIKYYTSEINPITNQQIEVYSYKEVFIQKKSYELQVKEQLVSWFQFFSIFAKCPSGIQAIFSLSSAKNIKCSTNFQICIFAEHLNYTLKMHLARMRFRGVSLSVKEVFYILKEFVRAGAYFWMNGFEIKSFDPSDMFLSSAYEVKIPYQNISYCPSLGDEQPADDLLNNKKQVLYLSPQQMSPGSKMQEVGIFQQKTSEIRRMFSLGMLILECSTMLDPIVTYYNYQRNTINLEKARSDVGSLKDKKLSSILSRMIETDPRKRIRFKQVEIILDNMDESMFEKYLLFD